MAKPRKTSETPTIDARAKGYLSELEVRKLMDAAKARGRQGARDRLMILMCWRHGLRVSELVALQWGQLDLAGHTLTVRRLKGSDDMTHTLTAEESRALHALPKRSAFVFTSSTGKPLTDEAFRKLLALAGRAADLGQVNPHILRHSCGAHYVGKHDLRLVQAWLGHRQIRHTVRYTKLSAEPFKDFA